MPTILPFTHTFIAACRSYSNKLSPNNRNFCSHFFPFFLLSFLFYSLNIVLFFFSACLSRFFFCFIFGANFFSAFKKYFYFEIFCIVFCCCCCYNYDIMKWFAWLSKTWKKKKNNNNILNLIYHHSHRGYKEVVWQTNEKLLQFDNDNEWNVTRERMKK